MLVSLLILSISTLIIYVLYKYKAVHDYFERNGIRYLPGIPLFGNSFKGTFYKRHLVEDIDEVYKAFPDEKYVGYKEMLSSVLLIRDPDIIRQITVKNFDHFVDRRTLFAEDTEPLVSGSLFLLRGDKWRDMRATLSPAFTSSKMKLMMPSIVKIATNIVEYLRNHTNEEIDVEDLIYRYAIDVIASSAFGVSINSVEHRENEFYKTGRSMFPFGLKQNMLFLLSIMFPKIAKKFNIRVFPRKVLNFFWNLINETIEYRERNNIVRPDMIQLLMEASKGTLKSENENEEAQQQTKTSRQWSRSEVMSQVFTFFAAGFETSSTAVTMTIHELALNPEVQEKLYQEIRAYEEQNKELVFDDIPTLKYLDCVLNESLRKWAPALVMERQCAKPYELPPLRPGAKPITLKPGDVVFNMVNSLHMDPKYFPNPDKFDPDRFRDDKRHIQPFTFMPFGSGPRNCIGIRFATLEVKIMIYYLVLNFKILKCPKTTNPIQLRPHSFKVKAMNGTWVKLEDRRR